MLGSSLLDTLTTPLWKLSDRFQVKAATTSAPGSPVQFIDVAEKAGLNVPNVWGGVNSKRIIIETKGSGLAFFDYDNDGWLDIYLTNGSRLDAHWPAGKAPTTHLYKNNRDGTFTDVTEKSGLGRSGWQTGVCVGDYDNDGWDDLFCTFWGHNILFHNNGNGTFTDVTAKAGLAQAHGRWGTGCQLSRLRPRWAPGSYSYVTSSSSILTSRRRSTRRAFASGKACPPCAGRAGFPAIPTSSYHNNGDGTFTDVSEKAGILKPGPRYSITSVSYDFDNDGWPDIYVAVDSEPSIFFKNNHDGTFTDIAVMAGCAYNDDGHEQAGMGLGVADYDCDGWFDIFKTNFADDTCNLYHNNGDGTFSDLSFNSGVGINNTYVAWGCGFIDYDNDGWADIVQINGHVYPEIDKYNFGETFKNPRLVYKNLGNGRFKDVSAEMGPGITARYSSRGAAFGDYDNDGGMDMLILNMNELPSLLHNVGGNKQNWIKLKLIGTKCNRTAIGARARVITGKHIQMDEVHSGTSVMSQNDLRLHFGVGAVETIDAIEVKWPTTQKVERFTQVKVNQILTIREGAGIVSTAKPKST